MHIFRFLIATFIVSLLTTPALAQDATSTLPFQGPGPGALGGEPTGPLNCFDYYTFGSVQADLQPSLAQTVPGATLSFTGEIKSTNPYPLLDGTLYVKIFRRSDDTFSAGDGNEVVDQFVIRDNVMLRAQGSLPVSYEWKVPNNAEGGEYYAAYFFTTAKRYNLMGLSFTDDVVGNQAPFTITASSSPIAKLSKVDTTLNDRNHHFAAFPLKFAAGDTVTVKTTITNPTNQPKTLPLQWNQYAWDAMNPDNLRFTQTDIVTLAPGETKEVSYQAQPQRESVVYVTAVTQDIEAKSVLNIRYVREGIEETRINFPGLSAFPLKKETEATLFACAHSTNLPIVPGNTLILTLKNQDGTTIHEYRYEGDIAGAMSGFGETFTPTTNINYATLTATLERNGVIVEQVTQTYDCEVIDPTSCVPEETSFSTWFNFFTTHLMSMVITLLTLIVLGILYFLYRSRRDVPQEGIDMTTPMSVLFFLLMLPSLFFMPQGVEAKSNFVTSAPVVELAYWYTQGSSENQWVRGLRDPNVTVNYFADIYNADTNALIQDGSSVTVGTKIKFVPKTHSGSNVSWFGTGYSNDSPNGHWINNAAAPAFGCDDSDYVTFFLGVYNVYIPFSINPPTTNVSLSGSTATLTDLGGGVYRVDGAGSISAAVNFSSTYGKFYYRYKAGSFNGGACTGDNKAMRDSNNSCGNAPNLGSFSLSQYSGLCTVNNYDYQLDIPARSITFNLTATPVVPANNPPTTVVTGPTTGTVNTAYTFGVRGNDPENNTVRVGVDWNRDGNPDTGSPYGNFSPSGTTENFSYTWTTPGTYTFQANSQDSASMGVSPWTTHTITIAAAPPITADLTINGSNGPIDVPKNTTVTLNWSSANAASCSKWGGSWVSGQAIPLSGSETTVVSQTTTYMVNCGGVQDTVTVNVVNQTPAAPSVAYASGNLQPNNNITFNIQGSDPDGDNVFYEVDWDSDGTANVPTMTVPSNTVQPATYSWSTPGVKTFQARTVDSAGARSGWTSHQVTLDVPIPATPGSITATCPAPGTNLSVTWSAVSGATSYSYRVDNQSNPWQGTCSPTNPGDYCQDGYSGTSVSVGGIAGSNFNAWVHACNSSGCSAPVAVTTPVTCVQYPNLTQPNVTYTLSSTFNATTGLYDYVDVTFQTSNNGGSNTLANASYEFQFDRGRDGYDHTTTGSLGTLTVGQSVNRTERVSGNIPFGNARIRVFADNTNAVTETNEGDNERVLDLTIPPPNPNLNLVADRYQIRNGETVTLTWSTGIPYTMNCRVYGPGLDVNPSGPSGSRVTPAISAKSEYTYTCTEPSTNTTFTDTVTVQTQGEVEEI